MTQVLSYRNLTTMFYDFECWTINRVHEQNMRVAEMEMLRWICGHMMLDKIRNDYMREKVGVAPI